MPKKTPKQLAAELAALRKIESDARRQVAAKAREADDLIHESTLDLLKALHGHGSSFSVRKLTKSKKVVLQLSFNESVFQSTPACQQALAEIESYAEAAGKAVVQKENA